MAFRDRISGMFGFGGAKGTGPTHKTPPVAGDRPEDPPAPPVLPEPATEEERQELLNELGYGFSRVGNVLERLDQNLGAGVRSLEAVNETQSQLPALIGEQQQLIRQAIDQSEHTKHALQALTEHLQQRDAAQQAIVDRLEDIGSGLKDQRDHNDRQLQLIMSFHRSSRTMSVLLIFGAFVFILMLVVALVALFINSGFSLSQSPPAPSAATSSSVQDAPVTHVATPVSVPVAAPQAPMAPAVATSTPAAVPVPAPAAPAPAPSLPQTAAAPVTETVPITASIAPAAMAPAAPPIAQPEPVSAQPATAAPATIAAPPQVAPVAEPQPVPPPAPAEPQPVAPPATDSPETQPVGSIQPASDAAPNKLSQTGGASERDHIQNAERAAQIDALIELAAHSSNPVIAQRAASIQSSSANATD